jgi:hypothetical protein
VATGLAVDHGRGTGVGGSSTTQDTTETTAETTTKRVRRPWFCTDDTTTFESLGTGPLKWLVDDVIIAVNLFETVEILVDLMFGNDGGTTWNLKLCLVVLLVLLLKEWRLLCRRQNGRGSNLPAPAQPFPPRFFDVGRTTSDDLAAVIIISLDLLPSMSTPQNR